MNEIFKRFAFSNIFFLCTFCCLFMVLKFDAMAAVPVTINSVAWQNENYKINQEYGYSLPDNYRYCIYVHDISGWNNPNGNSNRADICTNLNQTYNYSWYSDTYVFNGELWNSIDSSSGNSTGTPVKPSSNGTLQSYFPGSGDYEDFYVIEGNGNEYINSNGLPVFYNLSDVYSYISTGNMPEIPYDDTLELDSFKVTTWGIGNLQVLFKSKFYVTWSDSRISKVQVVLQSTGGKVSFESSSSPFKQKFEPENYVIKKGDVIHMVATPFTSSGSYGTSLYYSFVFDDNVPGSNIYRKFVNTPYNDNTLTIPYVDTSGNNNSVTVPVEYVTTNNNYKVNYNPVTYEYGDLNLYEVYYSPVIVYPEGTPEEEIDDTQEVINNTYTTNNYYETTKNINIDFDVSFGDISGSDIQHGFDDFGNFGNGFGGLLGKLSSWVLALFPFLNPIVASAIVVLGGFVIGLAIIAFVLKIASVIADLIPF